MSASRLRDAVDYLVDAEQRAADGESSAREYAQMARAAIDLWLIDTYPHDVLTERIELVSPRRISYTCSSCKRPVAPSFPQETP